MNPQVKAAPSWRTTVFNRNNVFQLFGMAIVGAGCMYGWDYSVAVNQQHIVEKELTDQRVTPAVDIHKVGLHGAWCDADADGFEPKRTVEDLKGIAVADAEAAIIFSTPGGKYTLDDIKRNGKQAPFARFHAYQFSYTQRPFPTQYFDPISKTKTSPIFNWYVGGQMYHFASIATLEEFVMRAKKSTAPLPSPDTFIKGGSVTCDEPDEDDKAEMARKAELREKSGKS